MHLRNLNLTRAGAGGSMRHLGTRWIGIPANEIPPGGDEGRPGMLYPDVVINGWTNQRLAIWIESSTFPALFVGDNSSWTASGLTNATFTATGRVFVNGVQDPGTKSLTLAVGIESPITSTIGMVETGDDVVAATVNVVSPVGVTVDVSMAMVELGDDVPGMTAQVTGGGVQIPGPDPFPVIVWADNALGTNSIERRYKQPAEVTDFDFDYSRWFSRRTDQPLTADAVIQPGTAMTLQNFWLLGQRIKVMVAGGTHNQRAKITVRMTTTSGSVEEAECWVVTREQ